ncbi:metallophosphoesterase family protein [Sulfurovum riftiae]|uniref:Metallophosphoesterase n=1 Tax=Sulfurovum riftiae TaxID=1630136 RepID=A0A151CJL3_9BACT|nr:metallophosphoesterase [Sulfurovum riftiae]KYJ87732.1 metallophosphoesterase [Sulfurovum riftiae]
MNRPLRILHFSDIHVNIQIRHMNWKRWFSKRAIGAVNLLRGRAKYFDETEEKMAALIRFKEENNIDIVINTGDYTALGLECELKMAREFLAPLMSPPQNYITVPGNHDIYVHEGKSHYRFSAHFCSVLQNDLPEYCRGGHWPLIRLLGDNAAVIAIDSAKPNPWPWRSDGEIAEEQIEALEEMLQDERVKGRFLFIITHYAPRLANGKPDTRLHGLINADALLDRCRVVEKGAILFGHVHQTYRLSVEGLNSELFCAGSATMEGHEGCWVYELDGGNMQARQVGWADDKYCFID